MADPDHAAQLSVVTWTRLDARPADVSEVTRPTRLRHVTLALPIRACAADSRRNQLGHTALDPYSGTWPLQKVSHLKATPSQKEDKKSVSIDAVLHRRQEKKDKKPYLSTAVQVRTPTGWRTLSALIDSEANENVISHLRVAVLGIKPTLDKATLSVTTIDETQFQVYGVYRPRIRATDNTGTTGESHSRLLAASFIAWDIVLGWPWLNELNPDINWRDERWSYRDDSQERPMP
ncbi:MAG: hypothetical protein M1816_001172 [Peltula sp. TS41687]|nr:MAG: hypothetical protein M1816_001172 [Peltula sp. TS41687]